MTKRTKIIMIALVIITTIATIFAALYTPEQSNSIARPTIKIGIQTDLNDTQNHIKNTALQEVKNYFTNKPPSAHYRYVAVDNTASPQEYKIALKFMLAPEPRVMIQCVADPSLSMVVHTPYQEASSHLIKVLRQQNIRSIGFITENKGNYKDLAKFLKKAFREGIFFGAVYNSKQTNFDKIINKLRNNDVQMFVLTGNPEKLDELVSALNTHGISNYQIASLYSAELSTQPKLYENIIFSGSDAGLYASKIFSIALENLISAYEASYKNAQFPDCKEIFEHLKKQATSDDSISVPTTSRIIKKAEPSGE